MSTTKEQHPVQTQVQNILKLNTKDEEFIKCINYVSEFHSVDDETDLRTKLEKKLLDHHKATFEKYRKLHKVRFIIAKIFRIFKVLNQWLQKLHKILIKCIKVLKQVKKEQKELY